MFTADFEIKTVPIREGICYSLISCKLFLEEQKGCHKGTQKTRDLLNINQHILKESNTGGKM